MSEIPGNDSCVTKLEASKVIVEKVDEAGAKLEVFPLQEEGAAGAGWRILELATRVYEGLSEKDISQIEKISLERGSFFGSRKNF